MFGKWVEIRFTHYSVEIFVLCTPDTPEHELQHQAMKLLNDEAAKPSIRYKDKEKKAS